MVKRFRILLAVAAAAALVIYLLSDDPPKRYPPEQGTLRVHGTLWPDMQLELGYGYRTTGDIDACLQSNFPVTTSTERGAGAEITGATDANGHYDLTLKVAPPDDGGECQWVLRNAELRLYLHGNRVFGLEAAAEYASGTRPTRVTLPCHVQHVEGHELFDCEGGDGFTMDLLPFDEHGRRELEFNIERVDPPKPLRELVPVDQMVGSPAYNARIRREQEAAERLSSSPDAEPTPGSP